MSKWPIRDWSLPSSFQEPTYKQQDNGACDEELDDDQQADDEADLAGVAVYARHDYGLLDSNNHAETVINKNKNDVNSWFSRVVWRPPFSPGIVTKRVDMFKCFILSSLHIIDN